MRQISPLQEYYPTDFSGLVTENHLGYIYQIKPQMASELVTMIYNSNLIPAFFSKDVVYCSTNCSRRSRFKILPMLDKGNSSMISTLFGTL